MWLPQSSPLSLFKIQGDGCPSQEAASLQISSCMNCLGAGHSLKQCHSKRSCRDCGQRHHSILHVEVTPQVPQPTDTAAASSTGTQQAMVAKPDQVSLGNQLPEKTSLVWMCQVPLEKGGRNQLVQGIIDSGSTMSFVTEKVVQSLKLEKISRVTDVTGLGFSHEYTS